MPAPLFPIAGRSLIDYPIRAAAKVPGLACVYVVGFYEARARAAAARRAQGGRAQAVAVRSLNDGATRQPPPLQERDFGLYLSSLSASVGLPVRYLQEGKGHGSAGGLHQFAGVLLEEKPDALFVLYCDVCCAFPLAGARAWRGGGCGGRGAAGPPRASARAHGR